MFSCFEKKKCQKELYFQIDNAINYNKDYKCKCGVYAIFKDNICLYVGQSKNLSSRISTHLKGKYSECDCILIYESYDRDETDIKELTNGEKKLIQILRPIENLIADYTEEIDEKEIFESNIAYTATGPLDNRTIIKDYNFVILNSEYNLMIASDDVSENLMMNKNAKNYLEGKI